MVHKLALIIGGVGAAAVLALAIVLSGFPAVVTGAAEAGATDVAVDQLADDAATVSVVDEATPGEVKTVVETIFVEDSSGPGRASNAAPNATPEPTAAPSDDDGSRSGPGRNGDDDDRDDDDDRGDHDDDHDDDDGDHSGHGHGGDDDHDDDDRSGHRDGDDDRHGDDD